MQRGLKGEADPVHVATSAPSDRSQRLRLYMVIVFFWASVYVFVPIMAPYAEHRGASLQTVGWLVSAYGLAQLILRIPLGVWSDSLRTRRPFILVGFLASFIGAIGMGFIDSATAMIFFRGLTGVCASMWVLLSVWYASHFDPAQTGKAMGLAMMLTNSTQLAANLSGGAIADIWGWQAPFLCAALLALCGFAITRTLDESPPSGSPPKLRDLLHMGKEPQLLTVSLLAALLQAVPYMSVYGFTSVYATELGATKTQLGLVTFAAGLPNAVFAYIGGTVLVPRLGSRHVVLAGFFVAMLGLALFPYADSVWVLLAFQMLVGAGMGLAFPALMALSIAAVPEERRATAMGFFQSLYSLGMFGGPVLGGALGQHLGLTAVFSGAAVIAGIGFVGAAVFLHGQPSFGAARAG